MVEADEDMSKKKELNRSRFLEQFNSYIVLKAHNWNSEFFAAFLLGNDIAEIKLKVYEL